MEQSVESNFFKKFKATAYTAHTSPIFQFVCFLRKDFSENPVRTREFSSNYLNCSGWTFKVELQRDCRQKTFVTLKGFCLLSKNPTPLFLKGKYQDGYNTNQNFLHCISCVLLIKIYKIQSLGLLFLVVFINFYISRYHFSKDLRTSFNIIWKKNFRHKFSFFNGSLNSVPLAHPLNSQNPLSLTKDFCHCCLFHMKITASVIESSDQDRDPWHSPIFFLIHTLFSQLVSIW